MIKSYKPIRFPKDESAHNSIIEWWYFNGHLKDKRKNEYSFMDCFFKADVKKAKIPFLNKIPLKTSYFSHSLISDHKEKKCQRRISLFSIISKDSFSKPLFYINYINPEINNSYVNCSMEKIDESTFQIKNEDIDLKLTSTKKPLLEGGNGFLDLHSKTTYYYSFTNLNTEGRIKIKDKWINVAGKSWMDHQWADEYYTKDKWDWFSIQLDNNTELVCCMYSDDKNITYFADLSYPNGRQEHFQNVEMKPIGKYWISPKSKSSYPLSWEIKIPEKKLFLHLTANIKNQEMLFGSINYWEGPLNVKGSFGTEPVQGVGFMELVGYPSKYTGSKYLKDEIKKATNLTNHIIKKNISRIIDAKKIRYGQ